MSDYIGMKSCEYKTRASYDGVKSLGWTDIEEGLRISTEQISSWCGQPSDNIS
jgi:hypothetical protein